MLDNPFVLKERGFSSVVKDLKMDVVPEHITAEVTGGAAPTNPRLHCIYFYFISSQRSSALSH